MLPICFIMYERWSWNWNFTATSYRPGLKTSLFHSTPCIRVLLPCSITQTHLYSQSRNWSGQKAYHRNNNIRSSLGPLGNTTRAIKMTVKTWDDNNLIIMKVGKPTSSFFTHAFGPTRFTVISCPSVEHCTN